MLVGEEQTAYSVRLFPQETRLKKPQQFSSLFNTASRTLLAVKDFKKRKPGPSPDTKNQLSHLLLFYRCLEPLSAKNL